MNKIKPQFKADVAETLLIPLYVRANESKERNPIINDHISEEILSKVDYDFSKFQADKRCQYCISLRTRYLDNVLTNFVSQYNDAVVVIVACGLDPRIERVGIKKAFQTYEIDFPDVINFRRRLLPESPQNIYIAGNVLDYKWITTIKQRHSKGHFLFLLEGIAMYLTEEQVKSIFQAIDDNFDNAEIYIERMNKFMSQRTERNKSVKETKAAFAWGCDNPREVEVWTNSFQLKDEYYYYAQDFSHLCQRVGAQMALLNLLPRFKRSFGIWSYEKRDTCSHIA